MNKLVVCHSMFSVSMEQRDAWWRFALCIRTKRSFLSIYRKTIEEDVM